MNRAVLITLLAATLLLAGCNSDAPVQVGGQTWLGGTEGLLLNFAAGMPPPQVFDDGKDTFSIGVQLTNAGESAVGYESLNNRYGYVEITGIKPREFNKNAEDLVLNFGEDVISRATWIDGGVTLQGAKKVRDATVPGEFALIEFSGLSFTPDVFGDQRRVIQANACYEYATFANAELCFKANALQNIQDATICELQGARPFTNSGGPVQLTSVVQNPSGASRVNVIFTFDNMNVGQVFAPWFYQVDPQTGERPFQDNACIQGFGVNQYRNAVWIELELPSLEDHEQSQYIRCSQFNQQSAGIVYMFGGAPATLSCTILTDEQASSIFTETLRVKMHYTYYQSIQQDVIIRDTNVGFEEPEVLG